jgi:hypothetical protein
MAYPNSIDIFFLFEKYWKSFKFVRIFVEDGGK